MNHKRASSVVDKVQERFEAERYVKITLPCDWIMTIEDFDRWASDMGLAGQNAAELRRAWEIAPWEIEGYTRAWPEKAIA